MEIKVFLTLFAFCWKNPDPDSRSGFEQNNYHPDPGGQNHTDPTDQDPDPQH